MHTAKACHAPKETMKAYFVVVVQVKLRNRHCVPPFPVGMLDFEQPTS